MSGSERETEFVVGPLFVAGLVVFSTANGRAWRRITGAALIAAEFTWPAYVSFKTQRLRRPATPPGLEAS